MNMNIFVLDRDPKIAAKCLIDVHTRKMITETAQMLANGYTDEQLFFAPKTQSGNVRKHSYKHHPCCKWVKESIENFDWLVAHGLYMGEENQKRFGKSHFSLDFIRWCRYNKPEVPPVVPMTKRPLAMKRFPHLESDDPVESYRKFYVASKQEDIRGRRIDKYTNAERPEFWYEHIELAKYPDYIEIKPG